MLIGFGVVVLPALLGGNGPNLGGEESAVTPPLDSKVFVSKITPIGDRVVSVSGWGSRGSLMRPCVRRPLTAKRPATGTPKAYANC